MVKDLPLEATYIKNRLDSEVPLVWLYEVRTADDPPEMIRLTSESTQVALGSGETVRTFYPAPISHTGVESTSEGDLTDLEITVGSASLEIANIMEASDGLIGKQMRLSVIAKSLLDDASAAISQEADIVSTTMTGEALTIRASSRNAFLAGFPPFRYTRRKCRWLYASTECGVDPNMGGGFSLTECPGYTLAACEEVGAAVEAAVPGTSQWPERFGGFPAIPRSRRFS